MIVVVINEEMARRFRPDEDPIGRRFKYGLDPGADAPWKTVVGVVADMRRQRLDEAAIPHMFQPGVNPQMDIAVRTTGDPQLSGTIPAFLYETSPLNPTVYVSAAPVLILVTGRVSGSGQARGACGSDGRAPARMMGNPAPYS